MKKRKATRVTKGGLKTWPMPEGFELPDDVGLLIGNRIHRVKASTRGIAVGGDVTASQVVGEQVIHGDSHVTFGTGPAAPAQPQRPAIAPSKRPASRPSAPVLTRAERDVAGYLGSDVSPAAIARALDVSAGGCRRTSGRSNPSWGSGRVMRPSRRSFARAFPWNVCRKETSRHPSAPRLSRADPTASVRLSPDE